MKKWKDHWSELLPYERKFEVASLIFYAACAIVFVFDILDKLGVLPVAFELFIVVKGLLAVAEVCQTVVYWRKERNYAYTSLLVAILFGLGVVLDIVELLV